MAYIGKNPTSVPLTSSDITDGIITTTKIADANVTNPKLTSGSQQNFRNIIINGNMSIDQRNAGVAQTISAGTTPYTVDRWLAYASGANATSQQVTGTGAFSNALRFTGAASNTDVLVLQRIESKNVSNFSGVTIIVQVYLWGSAAGTVSWGIDYANATDNFSAVTSVATGSISITTTPTLYTFTVATLPSNVTNGMQVKFDFGALASGVTRTITGVQLEAGTTASDFEFLPYDVNLTRCQRYYNKYVAPGGSSIGASYNGSSGFFFVYFPTTMRATPTKSSTSGTAFYRFYRLNSNDSITSLTDNGGGKEYMSFSFATTSAAGTSGELSVRPGGILEADAEL